MINVIYEDNHLLVVEKPINIPVQADISGDLDFLTMLKLYLKDKYNKPGNVYLGLIHRLDRPVGGIMVFAKTSKAASRLSEQVRNHTFKKTYVAVIEGVLNYGDTFIDYLIKNEKENKSFVSPGGKEAILSYKVIKSVDNLTLVSVNLKTGRHHQIRVQFSNRGFPLYGDQKYNENAKAGQQLALFSKKIEFIHPVTKEILEFELETPNRYPFNKFIGM